MRALMTVAITVLLTSLGLTVPAQADADLVVTWSATTRFNPDLEDYSFHVEDTGPGELNARWGFGEFVTIPHSGDVVLPFPAGNPDGNWQVSLFRCNPSCAYLGSSPSLEIRREVDVFGGLDSGVFGPAGPSVGHYNSHPQDVPVTLDWTLVEVAHPVTVLAQGTDQLEPETTEVSFSGIPTLPTGSYRLNISAEVDQHPDFGHLVGETSTPFIVDADAAVRFVQSKPMDIYPVKDGYEDDVFLGVTGSENLRQGRLAVVDEEGATVFFENINYWTWGDPLIFDGRDGATPLAPGTYRLVFSGRDDVDNLASATSPPIVVHPEEMKKLRVRRTFKASKLVTSKLVGSCSTLRKPSSHGWKGSLGYLSQTKCRRDADSVVLTVNGVSLPQLHSDDSRYGRLTVTMFGGAAKGSSAAYINMGLFDAKKDVIRNVRTFRGHLGEHVLTAKYASDHVRSTDGTPTLYWQMGLTDGSRYDVKTFTVELKYVDLVMPSARQAQLRGHVLPAAHDLVPPRAAGQPAA